MQVLLDSTKKSQKEKIIEVTTDFLNKSKNIKHFFKFLVDECFYKSENNLLDNAILVEAACKVEPGIGLYLLTHLACIEIAKKANNQHLLNELTSGNKIGCFSLTEENAGSDITRIETTAKEVNNQYILNGNKVWSSNGSIADFFFIFAQTKEIGDKSGITCFLHQKSEVKDQESKEQPSFEISKDLPKLGVKITPSNKITFNKLEIKKENIIGEIGAGGGIALEAISNGRVLCAAQAVGLLTGVLEEAAKYSLKRNQFGKSISEFQAIQWYIADMQKDLDAARLLLYKAAWSKENNVKDFNKLSSMAKFFNTDVASKHASKGVQILGGSGLLEDSYVAKAYRDAKVLEVYEGTNEIQKLIISKELNHKQ